MGPVIRTSNLGGTKKKKKKKRAMFLPDGFVRKVPLPWKIQHYSRF